MRAIVCKLWSCARSSSSTTATARCAPKPSSDLILPSPYLHHLRVYLDLPALCGGPGADARGRRPRRRLPHQKPWRYPRCVGYQPPQKKKESKKERRRKNEEKKQHCKPTLAVVKRKKQRDAVPHSDALCLPLSSACTRFALLRAGGYVIGKSKYVRAAKNRLSAPG
eukprot:2039139-Rhodomonas_salina.1